MLQPPELHLPAPNPFIPSELAMLPQPGAAAPDAPLLLEAGPQLRLWHKAETRFNVPKAVVYLDFQCPEAYASPASTVLTRLAAKLLADALNEAAYPAEVAGLAYTVTNTLSGFQVCLGGGEPGRGVRCEPE